MRSQRYLRGVSDRDDRKVLALRGVSDVEIDASDGTSTDERMRSSTRRTTRPSRARFIPRRAARGSTMEVDLVGSSRREGLVRPLGVVPIRALATSVTSQS